MPCFRAQSDHTSTLQDRPRTGASWTAYWIECPCCSDSSSSTSSTSPSFSPSPSPSLGQSSSSSGSASSSSPIPISTVFVAGLVPDWQQPNYYESSGTGRTNIATNPFTDPNNETPPYPASYGYTSTWAQAWCAPTAAACLHGYLQHNAPMGTQTKLNKPAWIGDNADAGGDANPDLNTSSWNASGMGGGWADFLVDGPSYRFDVGAAGGSTLLTWRHTDFGWWMNTNNLGKDAAIMTGGNAGPGTWTEQIYKGLDAFYAKAYWTNIAGMVYHQPAYEGEHGRVPSNYGLTSHSNLTVTLEVIQNCINMGTPILAATKGWQIRKLSGGTPHELTQAAMVGGGAGSNRESHGEYYAMDYVGAGQAYIDGTQIQNNESYNERSDGQGLGHTVTVVGYIKAGSVDDIAPQLGKPATNWIIVRDNFEETHRNVILPFDQALDTAGISQARSFFNLLTATFYVNPSGAVYSSPSPSLTSSASPSTSPSASPSTSPSASGTTSSSSSSASAGGGGGGGTNSNGYYLAWPCVANPPTDCAEFHTLTGGIPIDATLGSEPNTTLFTCVQNDGNSTVFEYKFAKVDGVAALGTGTGDCALLIKQVSVSGANYSTTVYTGYMSCYLCGLYLKKEDEQSEDTV